MVKRSSKNLVYVRPLPLILSTDVYGPLPTLYPHNPISWIYYGFRYLLMVAKPVPQTTIGNAVVEYDSVFKVTNESDMLRLWRDGFFGKGNLSRSEPTWSSRHQDTSLEDITNQRRLERQKFKQQRSKLQELELRQRQALLSEEEKVELETLKSSLPELREKNLEGPEKRAEDKESEYVNEVEFLVLEPVEVFFLKFALDVVDIKGITSIGQLLHLCCGTISHDSRFLIEYVVYHHFRSLGWCVRSGIKFGCCMLLYKKGPPFSHAEYALQIHSTREESPKWAQLLATARVIGGVKKTFVLVYVDIPTTEQFEKVLQEQNDELMMTQLLKLYKVTEVLYKRWTPTRSRD